MKGLSIPSRQLIRLCRNQSLRQQAPAPIFAVQRCRYSSSVSNGSLDIEAIRAEMLARPPQLHRDKMPPINSVQLTTALSEFLPEECYAKKRPIIKVPAGHHLVYFPLQRRGSDLCPDGTDPYHSPSRDTPFTRRMWAGGSIKGLQRLSMKEAYCLERIVEVYARGAAGAEKIFVEVLREYFLGRFQDTRNLYTGKAIEERRTLVFMREPSDEEKKTNLEQEQRIVKAPTDPDYSVTLTPTPTLLFHYSALTYNAHRIHLDRSYCREVEGHPDLLVHGPLSLTLMLSVLQSRLDTKEREFIDTIDYRHLAPLYVGQPMRVCVKLQKSWARKNEEGDVEGEVGGGGGRRRKKWDLWVENQDGSLCVRGTADTVKPRQKTSGQTSTK